MRPGRRRGLKSALAWPLAAGLSHPLGAAAQGSTEPPSPAVITDRPFRDSVGLQVKFYQGEPATNLHHLRELGVRWVREEHHWHDFEPTPGHYRTYAALANRLKFYRQHGIGVIFILAYGNGAAYPDTAAKPLNSIDPEAYGRYATAVARMLKDAGVRFVLEVWNEPHNGELPKRIGGQWNGAPPSPWVAHYARMVRAVRDAARAVDPGIKVLSQDDMWIVHYWFLEAGLPRDLDGFSIHPYQPTPERAAVAHDTDWCRPFQVVDRDASFRSGVRRLKEQGELKLGRRPEVWITEMGWPVSGPEPAKGAVPERTVAAYLPRSYIGAFAAGIEVTCWFSSFDGPDGPMGLRDNRGDPRLAFGAFQTLMAQIGPMRIAAQLAGQQTLTTGLQAYHFTAESGEQRLVLWCADDRPRVIELPFDNGRDMLGKPLPMAEGGRPSFRRLTVGAEPVYLTGRWQAGETLLASWRSRLA